MVLGPWGECEHGCLPLSAGWPREHSDASGGRYWFLCMAEALTKPLPCLPILMTTSCHTRPPLAEPQRCLCQSKRHWQPLWLSMTSGWHHWKDIKVIKSLVVHYCKGQCHIKTHRSVHTESKLRCFTPGWMRGQLSSSSLSGKKVFTWSICFVKIFSVYLCHTPWE